MRTRTNEERLEFFTKKGTRVMKDLEEMIRQISRAVKRLATKQRRALYYDRQIAIVEAAILRGEIYPPKKVRRNPPKGGRKVQL